jgi:hypothetical protein
MGQLLSKIVDPLCAINVPRKLRILDPFLGLVQYSLWALVFSYYIYGWIKNPKMVKSSETPVSFANFAFVRGSFNRDRNVSWDRFPYCANASEYDYNPGNSGSSSSSIDAQLDGAYWSDTNIRCMQYMYADLVRADGADAYLLSYEKFTVGTTRMCDSPDFLTGGGDAASSPGNKMCRRYYDGPESVQSASTQLNGGRPYVIREGVQEKYSCTCLENWNRFPIAPERLGFSIFHAYQTSPLTYSLRGASGKTASSTAIESPVTTVRRMVMHGEEGYDKEFTFGPGEEVELPVMELLWMAAGTVHYTLYTILIH